MAAVTGKDGSITIGSETLEVINFSVDIETAVATFASSATAGWTKNTVGPMSWTATAECHAPAGDRVVSVVQTNAACVFTLSTGNSLTGTGTVVKEGIKVDIESGEPVSVTLEITGNGAIT